MFLHAPLPLPPPSEQGRAPAAESAADSKAAAGAAGGERAARGGRIIRAGDMVIVYENVNSAKFIYVQAGGVFQNRYGTFRHDVRPFFFVPQSPSAAAAGRRD